MAKGDALFFQSKGFRGFRGLLYFVLPKLEARAVARWLMDSDDSPWRSAVPDAPVEGPRGDWRPLVCAFTTSDGALWRIRPRVLTWRSRRRWRIESVRRGTPEFANLSGFLDASMKGGGL